MGRGAISHCWASWVAECTDGRCDFPLVMLSCLQKCQFGGSIGDARESRVEVVEGGFPRIIAQGYIIISKVKIQY